MSKLVNIGDYKKLDSDYFERPDVVEIARDLVGKYLCTQIDGQMTVGEIVETEAYNGRNDRASHAFGRKTGRTTTMYGPAGVAYIYLCYGIHHLFNIVTNRAGLADAVLIRALEPKSGIEFMKQRRDTDDMRRLTNGPGSLSQAMGIQVKDNGASLLGNKIWLLDNERVQVDVDRRVGVDYAGSDAFLPWRFMKKDSKWISKGKQKVIEKVLIA